jgi:hypothetical protein
MDPKLTVPQLPLEVLNHIFSFLRNDIPSLSACISATPYFQAIGEKHLWHHFTLHNHNTYDPNPRNGLSRSPAQLSKILADTPHVATYIRSLEISIASPSILQWFMKRSLNDEEMAPVLPMLPHLECISVAGGCISWDRLHQGFQAALVRALCLPSVKEAAIEGVDGFPLSIFNRCTALRRLSLTRGHFAVALDDNLGSLQTGGTRPSLESLTIRDDFSLLTIIEWLCNIDSLPDITNLRFLDITIYAAGELSCVAELLRACSNSLCGLELTPSTGESLLSLPLLRMKLCIAVNLQYDILDDGHRIIPPDYPTPPLLSLSKMPSLRSLIIVGEIRTSDEFYVSSDGEDTLTKQAYSTPLSWICHFLETVPPSLTNLTLDLLFKIAFFGNLKWIRWEELARALSSSHLGGLRRVELNVSFETTWNASLKPDEGLGILRNDQHLSELRRRGLLVVQSRRKSDEVHVHL